MLSEGLGTVEAEVATEAPAKPKHTPGAGLSIQMEWCERYGISLAEMKSDCRKRRFVIPRHGAMAEIRRRLRYSYPKIGLLFNKDHTSVLNACRKAGIPSDPAMSDAALRGVAKRQALAALVLAAS